MVGKSSNDINSSEYLHKYHGVEFSPAPHFDLDEEYAFQQVVAKLISNQLIQSAHDVSEGGLFISVLESAFVNGLGFEVAQAEMAIRADAYWFGEAQSRAVVSISTDKQIQFEAYMKSSGIDFEYLGKVIENAVVVNAENWGNIKAWESPYNEKISSLMGG